MADERKLNGSPSINKDYYYYYYYYLQELTVALTPCRLFMESVVAVSTSIPAFFTFSIYRSMEFS